jgi:hypothetical protein
VHAFTNRFRGNAHPSWRNQVQSPRSGLNAASRGDDDQAGRLASIEPPAATVAIAVVLVPAVRSNKVIP